MGLYGLARPLLFLGDPEDAHDRAMAWLARVGGSAPLRGGLERLYRVDAPALRQTLWGLDVARPVGLAAGFDKSCRAPLAWQALGFGFAELGTVTPLPQDGNPRPRIFRDPRRLALVNRLGFNNDGAAAVAERLARAKPRATVPLGVNIGKQRETHLDDALADYLACLEACGPSADFVVVNVSSPNTPGLRALQEPARLRALLEPLATRALAMGKPLLVKLDPDLAPKDLEAAVGAILDARAGGIVATNTSSELPRPATMGAGGVSGLPLKDRSTAALRRVAEMVQGQMPLVGVGGVFTADDAYEKIRAGASLVEVYTGFIYGGPGTARDLHRGLAGLLARDGFGRIADAVGADLKEHPRHR
ncbi:MAG TPA: quinone-dependent dihydroorotate dehydrogenase [Candidatus Thermoplasmatota archaeon]|jgi:dihydroorotate dehydrogenase|nr:quinone-dependent dihydroorotate dehydrogenase [Candidatus Thermoplasmatota archaeon]